MLGEKQLIQPYRYSIIRQIGAGGSGLTYLVEDTVLKRQVVIKKPNPLYSKYKEYEEYIRRFQSEGQALAQISHPNIVRVIDFFQDNEGIPYLVMEYVEGETLDERIRNRGYLPAEETNDYFLKLAMALQILHDRNIIHCDIHPKNIIIRPSGEPVLIDFGSATFIHPHMETETVTTAFRGHYACYDQNMGIGKPQPNWDIYSLAATLYFVLTGKKPQFSVIRKMSNNDDLISPIQYRPNLDVRLNQAILAGMALEAKDRPSSMQSWLWLLQKPLAMTEKQMLSALSTLQGKM